MRLEDLTAEVRPRGPMESVDLGFAMARRHFGRLFLAWLLCVGPIWALLLWSAQWIGFGWAGFLIWWWKPLYERVPLFIISRALFGSTPTISETIRAWPRLLFRNLGYSLFGARLSTNRTLLMPVTMLEGLKGKARSARAKVLDRFSGRCSGSLTFACSGYELCLTISLAMLLLMFVPVEIDWGNFFLEAGYTQSLPPPAMWLLMGCWLAAMTLIGIFYSAAGFGLYLNTRTHLEGWDVDLAFRRLGRRLAGAVAALCLFLGIGSASAAINLESSGKGDAKEKITEVLKSEDFKVHKVTTWESDSTPSESHGFDLGGLGTVLEVIAKIIFYGAIAVALWFLIRFIMRHLHTLRGLGSFEKKDAQPVARSVAGLDVRPESLPADIAAAARQLWMAGDTRAALSLLYRGSLSWLVHARELPIRDSDTEGDCLRRAAVIAEPVPRNYFTQLTAHWVTAAYAGKVPPSSEMETLLAAWPYQGRRRA